MMNKHRLRKFVRQSIEKSIKESGDFVKDILKKCGIESNDETVKAFVLGYFQLSFEVQMGRELKDEEYEILWDIFKKYNLLEDLK